MLRTLARSLAPLIAAVWLAADLGVPAQAEQTTPQPEPPRDQVVPEGIEGLTAEEIAELAIEAAQAGDTERYLELLAAAAYAGDAHSARQMARLAYGRQWPGWPETALRYVRPIADGAVLKAESFYWLGFAGENAIPSLPEEQTDLWYRIAAWHMANSYGDSRADLQVLLDHYGEDWLSGGEVSWRFRELVGEAYAFQAKSGSWFYEQALSYCSMALEHAGILCLDYLEVAARKDHPRAQFDFAWQVLNASPETASESRRAWAMSLLCLSGQSGVREATILLARKIVENDLGEGHFRPQAYYQIGLIEERNEELEELFLEIDKRLSHNERWQLEYSYKNAFPISCSHR